MAGDAERKLPDGYETELRCPMCGPDVRLVAHTNRRTGKQFLGCANYPECVYTRNLPDNLVAELWGQKKLF